MKTYPWKIRAGASSSQWINATLLRGHPNETISARADREAEAGSKGWAVVRDLADAIFGQGHCQNSRLEDADFAWDIMESSGLVKKEAEVCK